MEGQGKKTITEQDVFDVVTNKANLPFDESIQKTMSLMIAMRDSEKAYRQLPHVKPFYDRLAATPFPVCELLTVPGEMDTLCKAIHAALPPVGGGEFDISIENSDESLWKCGAWSSYVAWRAEMRDDANDWWEKDGCDNYICYIEHSVEHLFIKTWQRMYPYLGVPARKDYGQFVYGGRGASELIACPLYERAKLHMKAVCAYANEKAPKGNHCLDTLLVDCPVWRDTYSTWEQNANSAKKDCKMTGYGNELQHELYLKRIRKAVLHKFVKYWNEAYPEKPAVLREFGNVHFY